MKVALIAAVRMNSARYPGKCLAPFLGLPLLQHTINLADKLNYPLFVHTRDQLIMEYVRDRCPILYEPAELLGVDRSKTLDRMRLCNRALGAAYIILLQPTHPLRKPSVIKQWIDATVDGGYASARSAMEAGGQLQDSGSFYAWSSQCLLGHYKEPKATFVELPPADLHTKTDFEYWEDQCRQG